MSKFSEFCKHQHDIECNQKYNKILLYSFHLNLVDKQVDKFKYLIKDSFIINEKNHLSHPVGLHQILSDAAWGHDLIEDARITYNDVVDKASEIYGNSLAGKILGDIIYSCTELRGKNRDERHGFEYFRLLRENKFGLFVKLCDIAANVGYGLLTNSSMYNKYQKEFPKLKEQLYISEFDDLFNYIEKLLTIKEK